MYGGYLIAVLSWHVVTVGCYCHYYMFHSIDLSFLIFFFLSLLFRLYRHGEMPYTSQPNSNILSPLISLSQISSPIAFEILREMVRGILGAALYAHASSLPSNARAAFIANSPFPVQGM